MTELEIPVAEVTYCRALKRSLANPEEVTGKVLDCDYTMTYYMTILV